MPNRSLSLHNEIPTDSQGVVALVVDADANTIRVTYKAGWSISIPVDHRDAEQLIEHDIAVVHDRAGSGL
jgi:hypothetical protein